MPWEEIEVPNDELDSYLAQGWQPVGSMSQQEEPEYVGFPRDVASRAIATLPDTYSVLGGLIAADSQPNVLRDTFTDTALSLFSPIGQMVQQTGALDKLRELVAEPKMNLGMSMYEQGRGVVDRIRQSNPVDPDSVSGIVAESIPGLARTIGAGMLGGAAAIPLQFGADTKGQLFGEYVSAGADPEVASNLSDIPAGVSALSGALLPPMLRSGPWAGLLKAPAAMGAMSIPQVGSDIVTRAFATGEVPSGEQILDQLGQGVKAGAVLGLGMHGATRTIPALGRRVLSGGKGSVDLDSLVDDVAQVANDEALMPRQPPAEFITRPVEIPPLAEARVPRIGLAKVYATGGGSSPELMAEVIGKPYNPTAMVDSLLVDPVTKRPLLVPRDLPEVNDSRTIPILKERDTLPEPLIKQAGYKSKPTGTAIRTQPQGFRGEINLDQLLEGKAPDQFLADIPSETSKYWTKRFSLRSVLDEERGAIGHESLDDIVTRVGKKYHEIEKDGIVIKDKRSTAQRLLESKFNRTWFLPRNLAKTDPEFKGYFTEVLQHLDDTEQHSATFAGDVLDYRLLPKASAERVGAVLESMRIARVDPNQVTPEMLSRLKIKLDPTEIKGVLSHVKTMQRAVDILEEGYMAHSESIADAADRAAYQADVKELMGLMRKSVYVPASRHGRRYVSVRTLDGELLAYPMMKSEKTQINLAKEYETKGYVTRSKQKFTPDQIVVEAGILPEINPSLLSRDLPANMAHGLEAFSKEGVDALTRRQVIQNFETHLAKSTMIEGYSKDFRTETFDYLNNLAAFASHLKNDWKINKAINAINPESNNKVKEYALQHYERFKRPNGFKTLRRVMGPTYLGFNLASPILNLTQPITMTYPLIAKHLPLGTAESVWLKSTKQAFSYARDEKAFMQNNPKMAGILDSFVKQSITAEKQMMELVSAKTNIGVSGPINDILEGSMKLFSKSERANRIHAAITALNTWEAMPKAKRAGLDQVEFVKDFVYTSQGMYNKANLPEIATRSDVHRLAFTFRMFPATWLSMLKNEGVNPAVAARIIGTMIAVGGVNAIPGFNILEKAATVAKIDVKGAQRKLFGEGTAGDVAMYGLPMLFGMNLSSAMGLFNISDQEKSPIANLVRTIGGAPVDFIYGKPAKALYYYNQHPGTTAEKLSRASEALLPRGLANMKIAARVALDDAVTRPNMEPIINKPSMYDIGLKAVSLNPGSWTKVYEQENRVQILKERLMSESSNYNARIAYARVNGDRNAELEYRAELKARGITPNESVIKRQIKKFKDNPAYRRTLVAKRGREAYDEILDDYE
jgi:hypothetical protein